MNQFKVLAWLGVIGNIMNMRGALRSILVGMWINSLPFMLKALAGLIISFQLVAKKRSAIRLARLQIPAIFVIPTIWGWFISLIAGNSWNSVNFSLSAFYQNPTMLVITLVSVALYVYIWIMWGTDKAKEYASR